MHISFEEFSHKLEHWYHENGRDLPWRKTEDPYKIWISEIMLQQTQVDRVKNIFYPRFLEKFPDIETLAKYPWEEVYPYWKGLGYYTRGQNVLQAAQKIVQDKQGIIPKTQEELLTLPGIGRYTACAILSFAYDEKFPAIDTNIKKIIQVLWPQRSIEKTAHELIQKAHSGRDWNNAMMDLSTALRQGEVIMGELGVYFSNEIRQQFKPSKNKKSIEKKQPKRKHLIEVGVACIYKNGKYLIQSRPKGKSFEGLWEFPGGKKLPKEDFRTCVKREVLEEIGIDVSVRPHFFEQIHQFETVSLLLRFHRCQIQSGEPTAKEGQMIDWVSPQDFEKIHFLGANALALEKLKKMRV